MIPEIFPIILSLTYLIADSVLLISFYRIAHAVHGINIDVILLLKFKDLLEFYNGGEASSFVSYLVENAQSSGTVTVSQFVEKYGPITGEVEKLYERFRLPYVLKDLPADLRMSEIQCLTFAAFNAALTYGSWLYHLNLDVLFAILLVNTIFWYPLMSTYISASANLNYARKTLESVGQSAQV